MTSSWRARFVAAVVAVSAVTLSMVSPAIASSASGGSVSKDEFTVKFAARMGEFRSAKPADKATAVKIDSKDKTGKTVYSVRSVTNPDGSSLAVETVKGVKKTQRCVDASTCYVSVPGSKKWRLDPYGPLTPRISPRMVSTNPVTLAAQDAAFQIVGDQFRITNPGSGRLTIGFTPTTMTTHGVWVTAPAGVPEGVVAVTEVTNVAVEPVKVPKPGKRQIVR